ncbi:helix-turn-helix domain-containing protein [Burkholderia anthina]|uniref:helix-turn-helix domain-containing protein n=1 Tax=Burkholderia anthina TaxID=179879 RepID=UPI001FB5B9A0|nr:helix-turn-helix transcriptional regulator [Burkholderia anthina]
MRTIGERLKELIFAHPNYGERGQSKLSRDTGVPQPTISRILRGGSVPEMETLAALAVPFGVTCEWLLTERGPKYVAELYVKQQQDEISTPAHLPSGAKNLIAEVEHAASAGVQDEIFNVLRETLRLFRGDARPHTPRVGIEDPSR